MPFIDLTTNELTHKEISGHSFFPAVHSEEFYKDYRIQNDLPISLVIELLKNSVISIQACLMTYAQEQTAKGFNTLDIVPDSITNTVLTIDSENQKATLYKRAVFCDAKAALLKETQTVDRTADAENAAKTSEETFDKFHEFSKAALALIIGRKPVGVHLI